MPTSYDYTAIQNYGKALETVREKHREDIDACFALDYMIESNNKTLRLLACLSQHPGTWTDTAFDDFYTKNLRTHQDDNGIINITYLRNALDNLAKAPGEKLKALKTYHLLLGILFISLTLIAFTLVFFPVSFALIHAIGLTTPGALPLIFGGLFIGLGMGLKMQLEKHLEPTIPPNPPQETKEEQALNYRFFGIEPVELFDDALFTEVEHEFHTPSHCEP
jgi:hypothetical protein